MLSGYIFATTTSVQHLSITMPIAYSLSPLVDRVQNANRVEEIGWLEWIGG